MKYKNDELRQAQLDRDWWQAYGTPLGWRLIGWTFRESTLFDDAQHQSVNVTKQHVLITCAHVALAKEEAER